MNLKEFSRRMRWYLIQLLMSLDDPLFGHMEPPDWFK